MYPWPGPAVSKTSPAPLLPLKGDGIFRGDGPDPFLVN